MTVDYEKCPFPWAGVVAAKPDGSIWRIHSNGSPCEPKRIDLPDGSKGYRNVVLPDPDTGRWRTYKAHRLVWMWYHGPIPDELQINHCNLIKDDNRIDNLELVTSAENISHSYANGRTIPWSNTTEWRGRPIADKAEAINLRNLGLMYREIAASMGISISHAHRLCADGRSTGK